MSGKFHKVVVASDSFKGCLTSIQVADAVEKGIHEIYHDCEVVKLAVARRASARNIPVMAICGRTEVESLPCFASICPVTPQEMPLEQAMQPDIAMENIKERLVRDIALSVTN